MTLQNHEGRSLVEANATKMRVLQRNGIKMAIMLERIFWSQLDDIAKIQGTSTTKLVFRVLSDYPTTRNRTGLLRCYCLEQARMKASLIRLQAESFDMLGVIAACPTPVAVITAQRKIAAFNPSFSKLIAAIRGDQNSQGTAIQFSFSEAVPKIQAALLAEPHRIVAYQIGVQIGEGQAHFFVCRFALADRSKAEQSLILLFFENERKVLGNAG